MPRIGDVVGAECRHIDILRGYARHLEFHDIPGQQLTNSNHGIPVQHQKSLELPRMVMVTSGDARFCGRDKALPAMQTFDSFE